MWGTQPAALVYLLIFYGVRISKALGTDVRDYGHDHGHQVLKVTRKGGKTARVALAPPRPGASAGASGRIYESESDAQDAAERWRAYLQAARVVTLALMAGERRGWSSRETGGTTSFGLASAP